MFILNKLREIIIVLLYIKIMIKSKNIVVFF